MEENDAVVKQEGGGGVIDFYETPYPRVETTTHNILLIMSIECFSVTRLGVVVKADSGWLQCRGDRRYQH